MGFVEFIQDHRWWVLAICLPLIVIYGRVLVLAALGGGAPPTKVSTAPIRRLPPKPQPGGMVKPSGMTPPPEGRQEVLPGSLDAGLLMPAQAGAAKTVKLPVTPPKPTDSPLTAKKPTTAGDSEADALDSLFGKRDEPAAPGESPTAAMRRKASRMEELGFHHGIAPATVEVKGETKPPPPMTPVSATESVPTAATTAPSETAATPSAILPGGTAPRSSTAELTSILERIDKFLAEDTPAKPAATLPPSKTATTAVVKTVSDEEAARTTAESPAVGSKPADKATEAMPKVDADPGKPDPNKKTQPMWARPDAQDEDVDAKGEEKKPDGQQRLF
jgi:hypothetical protein